MSQFLSTALVGTILVVAISPTASADVTNVFDESSGSNTYFGGINSNNWTGSFGDLTPNSGSEALLSAFSNSSGLGFTYGLGGAIEDTSYAVSSLTPSTIAKYLYPSRTLQCSI